MAQGNLPVPPDEWQAPGYPTGTSGLPDMHDVAAAHAPPGVAPKPPPKPKRRRRWPYVIGSLLLLLVLLVLLAPTIAGTSPVRSIIVGQVNQRLNGKVEIGELSLGWMSSVKVGGLKVFDSAGSQILELPRLTTELSLLNAVRGKLHFGKVTVDGLNATVKRDAQGNLNFAQLVKQGDAKPQAAGKAPAQSGSTSKTTLPDVSGELQLVNCRATFEDQLQ